MKRGLEQSLVVEAEVGSVSHDNVVNQMDAHDFGSLAYVLRQQLVIIAGTHITRRVVVHYCYLRGIAQQCLAQDEAHVDSRLVYSTTADADTVYNL